MNVFGAFTFGSLIKTFLPGFVWLLAITAICADIWVASGGADGRTIHSVITDYGTEVGLLSIPLSLICGILSNIFVFMGFNDKFVIEPVKNEYEALFKIKNALNNKIISHYTDAVYPSDVYEAEKESSHIDPEYLLIHEHGKDCVAYVREQYWYYLEFSNNMFLAFGALIVALALPFHTIFGNCIYDIMIAITFLPLEAMLLKAARKNFKRHVEKMLTLLTGLAAAHAAPTKNS